MVNKNTEQILKNGEIVLNQKINNHIKSKWYAD